MSDNFRDLNKQISTFMLVSLALSTQICPAESQSQMKLMYAGPEIIQQPAIKKPDSKEPINIAMYAVPEMQIIEERKPPLLMYATPEFYKQQNIIKKIESENELSAGDKQNSTQEIKNSGFRKFWNKCISVFKINRDK